RFAWRVAGGARVYGDWAADVVASALDNRGDGRRALRRDGLQPHRRPRVRRREPAHALARNSGGPSFSLFRLGFHTRLVRALLHSRRDAQPPDAPALADSARECSALLVHEA